MYKIIYDFRKVTKSLKPIVVNLLPLTKAKVKIRTYLDVFLVIMTVELKVISYVTFIFDIFALIVIKLPGFKKHILFS